MNENAGCSTREEACEWAREVLAISAKHGQPLLSVFICKRRQGDFYCWPNINNQSPPPKSYKIVEERFPAHSTLHLRNARRAIALGGE